MPFNFGIIDIIDILLVALMLYYIYRIMKTSGSLNIFIGVLIFIVVWLFVTQFFRMRLMGSIFDKLINVGALALIILFQEDIRRFFLTLGTQRHFNHIVKLFTPKKEKTSNNPNVMLIVKACESMKESKTGALIIVEREMSLSDIITSGEKVDAIISIRLLKNIFFKNSPLHDGAIIISRNRIAAAGCILPVSHKMDIPKHLGLRHRAAMGISEQSDALAVIISEERGEVSVAYHSSFDLNVKSDKLEAYLREALEGQD